MSLVWGPAVVLVWGRVLLDGWREWRTYRDGRAKAELMTEFSLFIVSLCAFLAIVFFIFSPQGGSPATRVATTMALGAFLAAGIISATVGRRR